MSAVFSVVEPSPEPEATPAPAERPAHGHASDRAGLVALYNATDGLNWRENTNWLSDAPIGEWHGVTTGPNGRVIELSLHSNELRGGFRRNWAVSPTWIN